MYDLLVLSAVPVPVLSFCFSATNRRGNINRFSIAKSCFFRHFSLLYYIIFGIYIV